MKREQSAVTEESELPWTRALGIWGFATLLKGFWQIAFLQNSTLSKALNTAPSTTWSSWRETPKSNIPKKKNSKKNQLPQAITDERIKTWHSLKRPWTNSDLCGAPTAPSSVWCLFNKHQTADHLFVVEKGWNVSEPQVMTDRCHQTGAHSQRRWELTTTNKHESVCRGGCIWDSSAANHLFFCLFARQFRDGINLEEDRTRTTVDYCR